MHGRDDSANPALRVLVGTVVLVGLGYLGGLTQL